MSKTISVTCPNCNEVFEVELPEKVKAPRGQLAGIAVADMTDEQLKREIINAGSVLCKAKQRGAAAEVVEKNQARLDAAKAERDARHPAPVATEEAEAEETDADTAAEV